MSYARSSFADLSRAELAILVPELLLIGQLIDRSGMAWCISAFGREWPISVYDLVVIGVTLALVVGLYVWFQIILPFRAPLRAQDRD